MKRLALFALAVGLLGFTVRPASAAPIYTTYNFSFNFDPFAQPGATATGSLTIEQNGDVYTLSQWNILVQGLVDNNVPYPTVDFSNTASGATGTYDPSDPLFNLLQNDPLQLEWQTFEDFDDNDTTQILLNGFFLDQTTGFGAELEGGALMIPTPEPATWALMGAGMLTLLGLGWRKRNAGADARA